MAPVEAHLPGGQRLRPTSHRDGPAPDLSIWSPAVEDGCTSSQGHRVVLAERDAFRALGGAGRQEAFLGRADAALSRGIAKLTASLNASSRRRGAQPLDAPPTAAGRRASGAADRHPDRAQGHLLHPHLLTTAARACSQLCQPYNAQSSRSSTRGCGVARQVQHGRVRMGS